MHALLPPTPHRLRCALHGHTHLSDGEPTPAGLLEHFARAGWDVVAITDHYHVTRAEHAALVTLPATELSARVASPAGECDVLAFGVEALDPELGNDYFPSLAACADWIVAAGGVAYLAHPSYSGLVPDDYLSAPALSGIEVYNAGSEVFHGSGLSTVHWDDLLYRGARPFGLACDDTHYAGQDSRLAWTTCLVAERSAAAMLEALRTGAFYASSGPELHEVVLRDDGKVEVGCSPAAAVTLRSGPWDGCRANADPHSMCWRAQILERDPHGAIVRALLDAPEFHAYGRVEVLGAAGGVAWTNAFELPAPVATEPTPA